MSKKTWVTKRCRGTPFELQSTLNGLEKGGWTIFDIQKINDGFWNDHLYDVSAHKEQQESLESNLREYQKAIFEAGKLTGELCKKHEAQLYEAQVSRKELAEENLRYETLIIANHGRIQQLETQLAEKQEALDHTCHQVLDLEAQLAVARRQLKTINIEEPQ